MFEVTDNAPKGAVIKVVGIGGGGGNAIKHMANSTVRGVEFCAINTDVQDLRQLGPEVTCLPIGHRITQGLGAGANPKVGKDAAEESREDITQWLQGANMLFIAAGMGGGTGTGAAPVVASIAKSKDILTVAVVTKPFWHENRSKVAEKGLVELRRYADTIIVVANDKLSEVLGQSATLKEALAAADDVLLGAVRGIADLITCSGLINVDFADVQTVMLGKGNAMMGAGEKLADNAMMGTGIATGEKRAETATKNAIKSPLLEDIALNSAKGLLVNITADASLRITEFDEINKLIRKNYAAKDAQIVMGTTTDENMNGAIKVTVVATGVLSGTPTSKDATQASLISPALTANDNAQLTRSSRRPSRPTAVSPVVRPARLSASVQDWDELRRKPAFVRNQEAS